MPDSSEASSSNLGLDDIDMRTWIKWCVNGTDNSDFERLLDEFRERMSDDEQTYIFNLRKDIMYLDMELLQLDSLAKQLRLTGDKEIITILQSEPYFITLPFDNLEADLNRMQSQQKAKITKLKVKEAEYQKHIEKHKDDKPPTENDWYSQLRVLGKWHGSHLSAKEITVQEYIVYLNDFKADVSKQKSQKV